MEGFTIFEFIINVIDFTKGLLLFFIFLTFFPYFVRIVIQLVIGFIQRIIKYDLAPLLDLIAIPGALIRNIPVDVYLRAKGWGVSVRYEQRVGRSVSNLTGNYAGGFNIFMGQNSKRPTDFRDTIFIMISSYSMTFLFYLWMKYANDVVKFFITFLGLSAAYLIFVLLSLSFALGGLPTSSETVLPLKFYFKDKPHLILGFISIFIGSIIINSLFGGTIAQGSFLLMSGIAIIHDKLLEKREEKFQDEFLFAI